MPKLSEQSIREEERMRAEVDRGIAFMDKLLAFAGKKRSAPGSNQALKRFLPKPFMYRHICPGITVEKKRFGEELSMLKRTPGLLRVFEEESFIAHPNLSRLPLAAEYLAGTMYGLEVECFRMLCLDRTGRMKENVLLNRGVYDASIFSLRLLLEEIERVKCDCVILCHNHPGGTTKPSAEDLDCTAEALYALTAKGVPLLDHIIVSDESAVSLRYHGYIPERYWLNQRSGHKLLANWLSEENMPDRMRNRSGQIWLQSVDPSQAPEEQPKHTRNEGRVK